MAQRLPCGRHGEDVPLDGRVELGQVDAHFDDGRSVVLLQVAQVDLVAVVGPRAELEHARLLVKGEVFDVDLATRFVDGRRSPLDQPVVVHGRLGRQRHLEIAVGAAATTTTTTTTLMATATGRPPLTLLVVEDNVGPPNVLRRNVEHVDASVIGRIPLEFVVEPVLHNHPNPPPIKKAIHSPTTTTATATTT